MLLLQSEALEGMTYGMPEVQGLTQSMLVRILGHDALLNLNAASYKVCQGRVIDIEDIEGKELGGIGSRAYEPVLEHLCITATQVLGIESA